MPRIFDNIEQDLLTALQETIDVAFRADFCVGYFNLRGWRGITPYIEKLEGGNGRNCRVLVGMQRLPQEEVRELMRQFKDNQTIDNQTALRLKKRLAEEFRQQLTVGIPTNADEAGLRQLAAQIRAGKVVVKLFLRSLHAKLYLLHRNDRINPIVGYLGSSNLTLAGLRDNYELNVDVLDGDACKKLGQWFEDRWTDRWCIDISEELVNIIEQSWAREDLIPPYHIYVKMAYHLSHEARDGLSKFRIPPDFGQKLFDFQAAAVKIAAHHLNKRGGVLIGDVVGLGKTLMATALARIFEDDFGLDTLIICPKNLVPMWEDYREQYRLRARILPISLVHRELPNMRRHRLVIIDESHNLRNREGQRYRAIQEYVYANESMCILLSATPYNKTYLDLSNQLRLFVTPDEDIGIRPEQLLREMGETEFIRQHQAPLRSLAAFEYSPYADDWRELMRLYMVRRTRSFIQDNYAETDPENGRRYLTFEDGSRSYFPIRIPRTVKFSIDETNPHDQYASLFAPDVVDTINHLNLPRYGLGNYISSTARDRATDTEIKQLDDLSRAGKRLMGFSRTNLFKRLESSGQAFIQSVERHILRNLIYLHAIDNKLDLPIGTQDVGALDSRTSDLDPDSPLSFLADDDQNNEAIPVINAVRSAADFEKLAATVYGSYTRQYRRRFKWLRAELFTKRLAKELREDAQALLQVLNSCGQWEIAQDAKLNALVDLLTVQHPNEKVLVFTQFADTVSYLEQQLQRHGIQHLAGVTGNSDNPTALAHHFSPVSNDKRHIVASKDELRVLIATDVLSEGQNLQDCHIIVNYDLPWAIIRLIQRAGRVDRIGQQATDILCYTFLPADGVERIIRLRARVRQRLQENAEVVGTDEAFFEDDQNQAAILNLYNEKAGILDGEEDSEVDLASYAYQIWKNAITLDPRLAKTIPQLPSVVFSTRPHIPYPGAPEGVLVYMRTAEGNDALAWIDRNGESVTESQFAILKAAECYPDMPALPRDEHHHELVQAGLVQIMRDERSVGGQLGRPSGARFRTYERLQRFTTQLKGTLFEASYEEKGLFQAVDEIYRFPLRQSAVDALNRHLRSGINDEELAELVMNLRADGRLCVVEEEEQTQEPRIICSLGLSATGRE
ncbi:MAG: NgoFVII family restriction endonuclease [Anaerolineae bacterium]|nr:NgoFVII family restriction endonuclease [Anaerolineae bacterium]